MLDEIPHKLVNIRVAVVGVRPAVDVALAAATGESGDAKTGRRDVLFDGEWTTTAVYRRDGLRPGDKFEGPAIVEQDDCTTVVDPGCSVRVDEHGNLVITLKEVAA